MLFPLSFSWSYFLLLKLWSSSLHLCNWKQGIGDTYAFRHPLSPFFSLIYSSTSKLGPFFLSIIISSFFSWKLFSSLEALVFFPSLLQVKVGDQGYPSFLVPTIIIFFLIPLLLFLAFHSLLLAWTCEMALVGMEVWIRTKEPREFPYNVQWIIVHP